MEKKYLVTNKSFTNCKKCDTKEEAYDTAKDLADGYEDYDVYEIKLIATAYIPDPQAVIEEKEN